MEKHPFVHMEISAKDTTALANFYHEAFNWEIQVDPQYNYHMWRSEGGLGGGFVGVDGSMYKEGMIIPYIGTDDIDASLKKVEALGGKTLQPNTPIPGVGAFAIFIDPAGNRIGLYKGGPPA